MIRVGALLGLALLVAAPAWAIDVTPSPPSIPIGQVMNVKQFGATGNGSTDDSTALQAAINAAPTAGGAVFIPPGTYNFATTLSLTKNLLVFGTGNGSILNYTGTGVAVQAVESVTPGAHWNSALRDLRITSITASTVGLLLKDLAVFNIDRLQIDGRTPDSGSAATGFSTACLRLQAVTTTVEIRIRGSYFTQCVGAGILADGSVNQLNDVSITDNTIIGNTACGINITVDGTRWSIVGNDLEGNTGCGTTLAENHIDGQGPLLITGNFFQASAGETSALLIVADQRPNQGAVIQGNYFVGNGIGSTVYCVRVGVSAVADGVSAGGNLFSGCTNGYQIGAVRGGHFGPDKYSGSVTNFYSIGGTGQLGVVAHSQSKIETISNGVVQTSQPLTATNTNNPLTLNAGLIVAGQGAFAAGLVDKDPTNGFFMAGQTGSSYDFTVSTPSGGAHLLRNPTGTSGLQIPSGGLQMGTPTSGDLGAGWTNVAAGYALNGVKNFIAGAPTISSGFGTSPSVTGGNTAAFRVNVGTGGIATSGVIAMNATAPTGWNCFVEDQTTANVNTRQSASTTTTVTFTTTVAWTASDILIAVCHAF